MSAKRGPARIFLVEDNADDSVLARRALQRCGRPIDLQVAEDGLTALELLLGVPPDELPDLVLLDLNLPRFGGLELLSRLRAEPATSLLPIVILSTSIEERDLREAFRRGANSYLRKPVNFEEFVEMVRSAVHYWLSLNQSPSAAGV